MNVNFRHHLRLVTAGLALLVLSSCTDSQQADTATVCNNSVVITGYWPPTNEMLRAWSTNPAQNPGGWQGQNWRRSGYDVYAYFPEFPPDGDPTNDAIGEPGSVGSGDLQVDYQATSRDFWRIMDQHQPRLLITTSRGGDIGWELEAVEGGHGERGEQQPAANDWIADRFGADHYPDADTVDPRSTDAIERYRYEKLPSQLPLQALLKTLTPLATELDISIAIDEATSGNYLSGFMGLHGLYYQHHHPTTKTAGHIHVGRNVDPDTARQMIEATLAEVLAHYPPAEC